MLWTIPWTEGPGGLLSMKSHRVGHNWSYLACAHTYICVCVCVYVSIRICIYAGAAAAKSLQSCPTLCDPIDGSLPGSPVPGILQARTLEWAPFPFPMHESEKWKCSLLVVSDSSRFHGLQLTRLFRPWDFPGKCTGVGYHCLLHLYICTKAFLLHLIRAWERTMNKRDGEIGKQAKWNRSAECEIKKKVKQIR